MTLEILVLLSILLIHGLATQPNLCATNPCGNGTCSVASPSSTTYYCVCAASYISSTVNGSETCVSQQTYNGNATNTGLLPFANPIPGTSITNNFFRHISVGYIGIPGQKPAWNYASKWNWTAVGAISSIKDQLGCSSCSAFAATAAMESLAYILSPSAGSVINLSVQQLLDCGADTCSGGWLTSVLSYVAANPLVNSSALPYLASENTANCTQPTLASAKYSISMFEEVNAFGWFGRMLAVQQQPVMVAIDGSGAAFQTYTSGIFNDVTCYNTGLNHVVLVVGYDLTASVPFWIIKNSWGQNWGENGYMRLAITSGQGICGFNVLPAYYPVMKTTSAPALMNPCFSQSYGSLNGVTAGLQNPCGAGICTPTGTTTYNCTCPSPFVSVTNVDGSKGCSPASPCSFYDKNPCKSGTCIDSTTSPGTFTCVCPIGYNQATVASTGTPTCVAASIVSGPQYYVVPPSFNVTCPQVYLTYGMSRTAFLAQNSAVKCILVSSMSYLPTGTVLNVTNSYGNCTVPYVINTGDTCASIKALFSPQLTTNIYGPGSPNPDLSCTTLQPGQMICVQRNNSISDSSLCTFQYSLQPNDTCNSLIQAYFNGSAFQFFKYNPGIYCSRISPTIGNTNITVGQVCLQASPFGTSLTGCTTGRTYTVKSGDTCSRVISSVYGGSAVKFYNLNKFNCADSLLTVGRLLCAP